MTTKVALIAESEHERHRLLEFASSMHWEVAQPPRNPRESQGVFDAVVAYKSEGGVDVFHVRYCSTSKDLVRRSFQPL